MSITATRLALAGHQTNIDAALAACAAIRAPLLECRDRLDSARADLRTAEDVLASTQRAEVDGFVAGADTKRLTDQVMKATAAVDQRRRIVGALEERSMTLERELGQLEASAAGVRREAEPLIGNVMAEIADDVLHQVIETRRKAAIAEAAYRTLAETCRRREWLPLASRLIESINRAPAPHWGEQQFPDWPGFVDALSADPATPTPAVLQ